jgi:hypothetical protein
VRPRNRHELEVTGCVALFVLVILTLVGWTLYEHGYLAIALAVVGVIAVSVGLFRLYGARVVRRVRANHRRRQHQGQERQEQALGARVVFWTREPPARSMAQERRKEEGRPRSQFERDTIVQRLSEISDGEFEQLVVFYFRRRSYAVEPQSLSRRRWQQPTPIFMDSE